MISATAVRPVGEEQKEHSYENLPQDRADLTFDYSKIDRKYWASGSPEDEIIIYKGAPRGFHRTGLPSEAMRHGLEERVKEIKSIVEGGDDEAIFKAMDAHTSYEPHTPVLSATFNPELAQGFAPTHPMVKRRKDHTIYRIRIKANRCIVDPYDTGNCGEAKEIIILGALYPDEITAVKIINDDEHSELLDEKNCVIRFHADKQSKNREVKNPSNWEQLR